MPNEKNLVPYQFQSGNEAREAGAKGGRASGVSRRRKRGLKEAADLYLSLPVADTKLWNALSAEGVEPDDIDNQMALVVGLSKQAVMGDAKAAKVLADIIGSEDDA